MVIPKQIAAQDKHTSSSRTGWVELRRQIIFYQFYEVNSNISPECVIQLADMQTVVQIYEKLSEEQETLLPNESVTFASHYLSAKLYLVTTARESETQPWLEPKN